MAKMAYSLHIECNDNSKNTVNAKKSAKYHTKHQHQLIQYYPFVV